MEEENEICPDCNGSGEGSYTSKCFTCGGSGATLNELCEYCDEPIFRKYNGVNVHRQCYKAGRAEAMGDI